MERVSAAREWKGCRNRASDEASERSEGAPRLTRKMPPGKVKATPVLHIKGYVGHPGVLHGQTHQARLWVRHLNAPKRICVAGSASPSCMARERPTFRPSWVALCPAAMHGLTAYDGRIRSRALSTRTRQPWRQ